jgi:N-acetylglucosaminyldiphosphoundecaprenol N-acetyl-beta-D-mannosaminyltransferase
MTGRQYLEGIPIDLFPDRMTILQQLDGWLQHPECSRQVVTLNASIMVKSFRCPVLRQVIRKADLVTIDGYGIECALRKRGVLEFSRMAGVELVRELLSLGERLRLSVFFYGGNPEIVKILERKLRGIWPGITIAGIFDGYQTGSEVRRIRERIIQCQPGLLLVGLGSPRQEIFLAQLLPSLSGTVGIGVGGAFEVIAGLKKEAPQLIRDYGWEWLYRMFQEPRKFTGLLDLARFWNRYLR